MQTDEALRTLDTVEELRRRTRGKLASIWFPIGLFGLLSLASTPLCTFAPAWSLGIYWPVAAIAGTAVVGRYYTAREARLGVVGPGWPYVAVGAAIFVGASIVGAVGGDAGSDRVGEAGPYVVVAIGYAAFAALARSAGLAVLATAFLASAPTVAAADAPHACTILALVFGLGAVAAAAVFRALERHRG